MNKEQRKELYETALKRFIEIYYFDPEMAKPEYKNKAIEENNLLEQDFDSCWNQLTDSERKYFSYNLCYIKTNGNCEVYFHVLNLKYGYYEDLELDEFRKTDKRTIQVYDCWGY